MKVKFLYNTLITIAIALVFLSIVASIQQQHYLFLIISIIMFVFLVWLKVKLLKNVKDSIRDKK